MPTDSAPFAYAFTDDPGPETLALLGFLPERWGRMPPLSRAVLVEAGRTLQTGGFLEKSRNLKQADLQVGLIGASIRGSLTTDLDFAATLKQGPQYASPALFGYTLANIPLAEAANHYGLTGPVYALLEPQHPLEAAKQEARRILTSNHYDFMLACQFDLLRESDTRSEEQLQITFTLVA